MCNVAQTNGRFRIQSLTDRLVSEETEMTSDIIAYKVEVRFLAQRDDGEIVEREFAMFTDSAEDGQLIYKSVAGKLKEWETALA